MRIGRRAFGLLFAALALTLGMGETAFAKRLALVIGNDSYEEVEPLKKAVADALAISAALNQVGYEVATATDLSRRDMNRELQRFASRIESGDEVLFYYAGHGIAIDGRNYLLPTNIPAAQPGQDDYVRTEAIAVDEVLDRINSRGARIAILVLDACRNNPFPAEGTRSLGGSRGLARIQPPAGTFIMYSAGAGQSALDTLTENDPDPNSVFTRSLLPLIGKSGLPLVEVARQVRRDVQKLASTVSFAQRPAYYDEVTGDFFFNKDGATISTVPVAKPVIGATGGGTLVVDPAAQAWSAIEGTSNPVVLRAFVDRFGDSFYATLASVRLKEIEAAAAPPKPPTHKSQPAIAPVSPGFAIKRDMSVSDWKAVQTALKEKGHYSGTIDGVAGDGTRRAVYDFMAPFFADIEAKADDSCDAALLDETNFASQGQGRGGAKRVSGSTSFVRHGYWCDKTTKGEPKSTLYIDGKKIAAVIHYQVGTQKQLYDDDGKVTFVIDFKNSRNQYGGVPFGDDGGYKIWAPIPK